MKNPRYLPIEACKSPHEEVAAGLLNLYTALYLKDVEALDFYFYCAAYGVFDLSLTNTILPLIEKDDFMGALFKVMEWAKQNLNNHVTIDEIREVAYEITHLQEI